MRVRMPDGRELEWEGRLAVRSIVWIDGVEYRVAWIESVGGVDVCAGLVENIVWEPQGSLW